MIHHNNYYRRISRYNVTPEDGMESFEMKARSPWSRCVRVGYKQKRNEKRKVVAPVCWRKYLLWCRRAALLCHQDLPQCCHHLPKTTHMPCIIFTLRIWNTSLLLFVFCYIIKIQTTYLRHACSLENFT